MAALQERVKRRKISSDDNNDNSISSMFLNHVDHREFIKYFNPIEASQLSEIYQIPLAINREIAEFATGTIEQCANDNCNAGICVLNEEKILFQNKQEVKWNYCSIENKYFCSLCKPSTLRFICCDRVQCVTNTVKCAGNTNDDDNEMCYDDQKNEYWMRYKCCFCVENNDAGCSKCKLWRCVYHAEEDNAPIYPCWQCFGYWCPKCFQEVGMVNCDPCGTMYCRECFDKMGGVCCDECNTGWCGDCCEGNGGVFICDNCVN